jgi:hypothetical protein
MKGNEMERIARVFWEDKITGATGHGIRRPLSEAIQWVADETVNRTRPNVKHWVELCEDVRQPTPATVSKHPNIPRRFQFTLRNGSVDWGCYWPIDEGFTVGGDWFDGYPVGNFTWIDSQPNPTTTRTVMIPTVIQKIADSKPRPIDPDKPLMFRWKYEESSPSGQPVWKYGVYFPSENRWTAGQNLIHGIPPDDLEWIDK